MKTHNENLVKLSKGISSDNIQKSQEMSKRLTCPSKATHIGSIMGITMGSGFFIGGLTGLVFGRAAIGVSSLIVGTTAIVTSAITLNKQK